MKGLLSRLFILLLFTILASGLARAQTRLVTGRVTAEASLPLPGVSVLVKGTTQGTATNAEGVYRLECPANSTLVFSSIGYQTQEVPVNSRSVLDVHLVADVQQLGEVVVTAIGIERKKKGLGYAVQEIQGADLTQTRTSNLLNALSGKIAGVQVTGSNGAPGASARLQLRGIHSIGKSSHPLFVVDGVPIDNSNAGNTTLIDYGNGAGAISPDDIASISVLKGPAAAALYGSRGANGVILITTRSGTGSQGLGIAVNTHTSFETPLRLAEYQNEYGQGTKDLFAFKDGKGGGVSDGVDESWGPRLDGRLLPQFDSPLDANGNRIATPFIAHPDNWKNFYETGRSFTNNIALTGGNEKGDLRLSLSDLQSSGILPNTNYDRRTLSLNSGYQLSPKLTVRAIGNFVRDGSDNRQNWGLYSVWFGRQVDLEKLKDYRLPQSIDQYNWNYNYWSNPYYTLHESTYANEKHRLYGNIAATYQFSPWLSLQARSGTDFSQDRRKTKAARYNASRYGSYGEEGIFLAENNSDFLLRFNPALSSPFGFSAHLGGNQRTNYFQRNYMYAAELTIPNVYNLGNSRLRPTAENWSSRKKVNSLYGSAQLSYRDYLFLDLTGRNDWSSTLASGNNSYFYPAAAISAVLTEALHLESGWLSFAKIRAGAARVGNDTDPYQLFQTFKFEESWGSTPQVSENNILYTPSLLPEITNSFETGVDLRLWQNRLGLDLTYYHQLSKNQILDVNVSPASGFSSAVINAGKLTNKGIELQLNATPVKTGNGLQWDIDMNYARNRNRVNYLAEGLTTYSLGGTRGMALEARVGQPYGTLFGTPFLRSPDGQLVYQNGLPQLAPARRILGNFTPDWTGGVANTFSYRGLALSALIDAKWGGDIYSQTITSGRYTGVLAETVAGREAGIVGAGVKNIGTPDNPQYVPNDIRVPAEQYHHAYYALTNHEAAIFDATYVKLREARLGYTLPGKVLGKMPFREVSLALTGRNLLLLYSKIPHIDPETNFYGSESRGQGVEAGQLLSTRSMGFHVSFKL
jgi:TonB-linked SusC/RagA family outer membrane protein